MTAMRLLPIAFSIALAATILPPQGGTVAAPGDPDSTFNSKGWLRPGLGPAANTGFAVVAQPDFKVVVAGSCYNGDYHDFSLFRYNTDGTLDPTFGESGKVVTSITWSHDYAYSVAIQADEKIVVGGEAYSQFAVARYNPDGSLDETFGTGGWATAGTSTCSGNAITLQPDGKIVIAGWMWDGITQRLALARFLSDGSLDPSFNGGIVTTSILDWPSAQAVAYHPDGGLVVAGRCSAGSSDYVVVARYTDAGLLDTSFDADGYTLVAAGNYSSTVAYAVAVQTSLTTSPKIVVAGSAQGQFSYDFLLLRLNNDGLLDTSFGTGGAVMTDFYGSVDAIKSVSIQYMGATPTKIVAAGYAAQGGAYDFAVARYSVNGTPDGTFDGDGRTSADFLGGSEDGAYGMIRTGGRILLVGYAYSYGSDSQCALARFNDNGTLDTTFDVDGKRLDDAGAKWSEARALLVQPDGKIVTAGVIPVSYNGSGDFALFRCDPTGAPDPSFNGDGWSVTPVTSEGGALTGLARQADGKLFAAGYARVGADTNVVILRLGADGTVDGSFGAGGIVSTRVGGMNVLVEDVAVQSDGKILVAGTSATTSEVMVVARFDAAGVLDNAFGASGFVTVSVGDGAFARAMELQSNGKIVVAGGCRVGSDTDVAVVRLNENGSLDLSFAGNGRVITTVSSEPDEAKDVIVSYGGRIVIGGNSGWNQDLMLIRYNTDGSLDGTFDGDGQVLVANAASRGVASLAMQPNGRLVVAWRLITAFPEYFDFALTRFGRDGALDMTFGNGGTARLDMDRLADYPTAVAIDGDGKAVVAGTSGGLFSIARFHGDGIVTSVGDVEPSAVPFSGLLVGAPHPNPTTHGSTIRFRTSESGPLSADIVDVTGRIVRRLANGESRGAGEHTAYWDGRDDSGNVAASGTYFLRIRHGSHSGRERITLLR